MSGIQLSALDEERFGIRTARTTFSSSDDVAAALESCAMQQVRMLIARCPVNALPTVQQMERQGFLLMDTLLYYVRHLERPAIPEDRNCDLVRPVRPGDEVQVRAIAQQAFQGYYGHYHADPRLDPKLCDEAYISWAERSCLARDVADEVLVAELDGRLAGFATLRQNNPEEGEGVLYGVAPWAQGRGIYQSFMIQSLEWGKARGLKRMFYSTQVTNIAVQKVWVRVGAEMNHAYYTFHRWFDEHSL
jgi:GNAT superfamily N-acetyltransferase